MVFVSRFVCSISSKRESRKCVFCSESFAAGKISGRLMLGQTGVVSHKTKNSGESVIVHSLVQMWNNVL